MNNSNNNQKFRNKFDDFYFHFKKLQENYFKICNFPPSIPEEDRLFLQHSYRTNTLKNKETEDYLRYKNIIQDYSYDKLFKKELDVEVYDLRTLLIEVEHYFRTIFLSDYKLKFGSFYSSIKNRKLKKEYDECKNLFETLMEHIKNLIDYDCDKNKKIINFVIDPKGGNHKRNKSNKKRKSNKKKNI